MRARRAAVEKLKMSGMVSGVRDEFLAIEGRTSVGSLWERSAASRIDKHAAVGIDLPAKA
jgi:hypothetical protein